MSESAVFKCLRCNHEYEGKYIPNVTEERSCPRCGSNSVRRLKKKNDE